MRKEVKHVQITCDLCGQETQDPWGGVSEVAPNGVVSIRYDVWYGGVYEMKDFCRPCHSKLVALLESAYAIGRGQKVN